MVHSVLIYNLIRKVEKSGRMDARIEKYKRKIQRLQRRGHHRHRRTKTRSRSRSTRDRRSRSRSHSNRSRRSRSRSHSSRSRCRHSRSKDSRCSTFESRHLSWTPESCRGRDNLTQQPDIEISDATYTATLPPHLLEALGTENPTDKEEYGENLHEVISVRWEETVKVGLPEKRKEEILKCIKIPSNCQMLQAPTLNPEVSAALTEVAINRDKTLKAKQQQLGIGLTFMGLALSKLLLEKENNITEVISYLSKAGQLLVDLHAQETRTRVQLIAPSLDKSFLKLAETVTRDRFLFGDNLTEKIKNNSSIEKSGQQIKKTPQTSIKLPNKGNWNGPPRNYHQQRTTTRGGPRRYPAAQSSRGRKSYAPPPRRPPPPAPARPERNYSQRARPRH